MTRRAISCLASAAIAAGAFSISSAAPVMADEPAPYMVSNIAPGDTGSMPSDLAAVGGLVYFSADDGTNGRELWRSDGTDSGTYMVADLNPGPGDSYPAFITSLGGAFLFTAYDAAHGRELWASDGTGPGTYRIEIRPGKRGSFPMDLVSFGPYVYFSASDGSSGRELWRTDYVSAQRVKDIVPGRTGSSPSDLLVYANRLYFAAANKLWLTDGTEIGTVPVLNSKGGYVRAPGNLTASGDLLYFAARTAAARRATHLWRTDGTQAGTRAITAGINPQQVTDVDGRLFFTTVTGDRAGQLWKSDGTKAGTVLVKDVGQAADLTAVGSQLYFTSLGTDGMQSLMTSDGSAHGTNSWLAANTNNGAYVRDLVAFHGHVYYSVNGYLMYDTCPASCSEYSWAHLVVVDYTTSSVEDQDLTVVGGTLFYSGVDWHFTDGNELWAYTP